MSRCCASSTQQASPSNTSIPSLTTFRSFDKNNTFFQFHICSKIFRDRRFLDYCEGAHMKGYRGLIGTVLATYGAGHISIVREGERRISGSRVLTLQDRKKNRERATAIEAIGGMRQDKKDGRWWRRRTTGRRFFNEEDRMRTDCRI